MYNMFSASLGVHTTVYMWETFTVFCHTGFTLAGNSLYGNYQLAWSPNTLCIAISSWAAMYAGICLALK